MVTAPDIEPAVPCDTCGAEAVVVIETTDLTTYERTTRRQCATHAPFVTPTQFIEGGP